MRRNFNISLLNLKQWKCKIYVKLQRYENSEYKHISYLQNTFDKFYHIKLMKSMTFKKINRKNFENLIVFDKLYRLRKEIE